MPAQAMAFHMYFVSTNEALHYTMNFTLHSLLNSMHHYRRIDGLYFAWGGGVEGFHQAKVHIEKILKDFRITI